MQEEAREHAEQMLQDLAAKVQAATGKMPILYLREGRRRDELLALIDEEPGISLLVLGMAAGREGPGPLVSYLVSQGVPLRLPVTLVPGALSEAEIGRASCREREETGGGAACLRHREGTHG